MDKIDAVLADLNALKIMVAALARIAPPEPLLHQLDAGIQAAEAALLNSQASEAYVEAVRAKLQGLRALVDDDQPAS